MTVDADSARVTTAVEVTAGPEDGPASDAATSSRSSTVGWWTLLWRDKAATAAALVLTLVVLFVVVVPLFLRDLATEQHLSATLLPPFSGEGGWAYVLGSDQLGRSLLARLAVGGFTTLYIAVPAVALSLLVGGLWGTWAGYHRGWRETVTMRIADVILSFPGLLLAVVVLYIFSPGAANIVLLLAFARLPIYLRTARAESAELQSRLFVDAARTFGASSGATIRRHVVPVVAPTLLTVATLDLSFVMMVESSLSFLGIGIQPPDMSLGLLVAQGREYLQSAWWLAVFPGVLIVVMTVCANTLAAWMRVALDPGQRWRLTLARGQRRRLFRRQEVVL